MNKNELINQVAKQTGLSRKEAKSGISSMLGIVVNEIAKGKKVTLTGFGTFDIGNRKARTGVNPRTGAKISIKAVKLPRFHPSKTFRTKIK